MEALAVKEHSMGGVGDGWLELGAAVSKFKRAAQSRQIGCGETSRDPQCAVFRGRMHS